MERKPIRRVTKPSQKSQDNIPSFSQRVNLAGQQRESRVSDPYNPVLLRELHAQVSRRGGSHLSLDDISRVLQALADNGWYAPGSLASIADQTQREIDGGPKATRPKSKPLAIIAEKTLRELKK